MKAYKNSILEGIDYMLSFFSHQSSYFENKSNIKSVFPISIDLDVQCTCSHLFTN